MKDTVLVTGDTSGLGSYLIKKFEKEGHKIMRHGGRQNYNLSNNLEVYKLAMDAKKNNVKILINNAAITCPSKYLQEYETDLILNMINVNLTAPILLSYYLLDSLKNIININSMVGLEVKKPRSLYSATKWGLRGFSNSLKLENRGVKILDVYPTNIQTKPEIINAMNVDMVVNKIYESYMVGNEELVLDGRKK